ncbi:copper homeostasis protein CutC [Mucilaginibacter arboris]|uniref:PF03932 family protein CutC n=1 Tax=Mucilaginibacter arboris TaxID=2682090 RepID=A0A7K1ST72_9SPHI|nr:copper homeostasis protein CutC [Mucilaginibacter arboris]MVN20495.1 copper homeostasis protein CutC [Mucilaginibacter arboris]
MIQLEVCANSLTSALAAQEAGAHRVELCDNLKEGGTTPSFAQIALARKYLEIKLYPIIRPRGGDFLYSDLEAEIMKADILQCRQLGCDGVVFGMLTKEGRVDSKRCMELKQAAGNLGTTFHRAFDHCRDPFEALEEIIEMGFERILTSGQEVDALKGAPLIAKLTEQARGRIIIMPGAGIRPDNFKQLIQLTHATEYHASAKNVFKSKMLFDEVKTGSRQEDFLIEQTDKNIVKELLSIAGSFA